MKLFSWFLAIVLAAANSGCSSSNDNDFSQESTDPALILGRTWALFAVQDDAGNQIQFIQEPGFEFIIEFFSNDFETQTSQEVLSLVGFNICNVFSGDYTLVDGVLTFVRFSQDTGGCEPIDNLLPVPTIFRNVLLFDQTPMLSVNTETDVLTIASGTNEALFFEVIDGPLFPLQ